MPEFDEYADSHRKYGQYTLTRGKYGFWTIQSTKGKTPAELSHAFTQTHLAVKAIEEYNAKRKS